MREVKTILPEAMDKFLRREGKKLTKLQKKIAKEDVGTSEGKKKNWTAKNSYHNGFKTGKIYDYCGNRSIRAYNSSPHGHLIEYGHMQVPRGEERKTTIQGQKKQYEERRTRKGTKYVAGRYVIKISETLFKPQFLKDCKRFLKKHYDDIGNRK